MENAVRKSVVVSAVNIRKGGTLTVLRDCLAYLADRKDLEVTAIVHAERLCHVDGINYIEIPWSIKSWGLRLWCEYVTLHRLSMNMPEPDLWLSLHDTTPRVRARRQAVYCHTSFPFLKTFARDWRMNPKIPLFAHFTKYAYRINVRRNAFLIVQQNWFRDGLSRITGFPKDRIIVAPPHFEPLDLHPGAAALPVFFYPATPDCHKNIETLCEAARLLERDLGQGIFKVVLTIDGTENRYARWLKRRWGNVGSLEFKGFLNKARLREAYSEATCLVFPSRVETWGLPISEFLPTGKPMLLADLPYSRETAEGAPKVWYFDATDAARLASMMLNVMKPAFDWDVEPSAPAPGRGDRLHVADWENLFNVLLRDENTPTR